MMGERLGALVGWKRSVSETGTVLSLQVASSADDYRDQRFGRVDVVLNDRQLRSLTRDLTRACEERKIPLRAEKRPFPWPFVKRARPEPTSSSS